MKRIIVPTNFSATAWNATMHAMEYCEIFCSELLLIHVFEYTPNDLNTNARSLTAAITEKEEALKQLIIKIKAKKTPKNFKISYLCKAGSLFGSIETLVSDSDSTLLVMGTKGRKGMVGTLFGSNTSRLMNAVNCNMLVVPTSAEFSLLNPITLALDYGTELNSYGLDLMEKIIKASNDYPIKLIHVMKNMKNKPNLSPLNQFCNFKFQYDMIPSENVLTTIESHVENNKTKLLVLTRIKQTFFKNIFQRCITTVLTVKAKMPILILQTK